MPTTRTRRRAEYATDASNYRVVPAVVAFPRHAEEAAAALAVARQYKVPVTSRGGGTSIAGNSVGPGIVLDFSRHLNRVLAVDAEARTATAEPGAILDDITAAAAGYGLRFGPDPSSHARASIGGSIGNNACGSRALRYGRTADNVVSLDLLTAAGDQLQRPRQHGRDTAETGSADRHRPGQPGQRQLALIRTEFGRFTRQVSGYSLEHLLPENGADLARFLAGTEGTLGIVTAATVRLVRSPNAVALAVLGYPGMPEAADAVPGLLPHRPVALEGMDARLVDVVRNRRGAAAVPTLPRGQAWIFAETAGDTEAEARAGAERLIKDSGALDASVVTGAPARALWRIREDGAGLGGRTPAGAPAWPGWEDAAVPPAHLGSYLREFTALLASHDLDGLLYGHFGDGCVHVRIDFPLATAPGRYREFALAAAQLAGQYGGSMSGEHGDGRARGELLPYMYSPEAIEVMAAVKAIFDPGNLLNPGVLVDPAPIDADLRAAAARPITRASGSATRTTAATCPSPCTAAPAWASAGPIPRPPAASCARPTWPPGTRRIPPAAAPASCRSWPTAPWSAASAPQNWRSRWTCACPARAARPTARPGWTWLPTRPRCSTSGTGAASARPPTTRWAGCPAGPGSPPARRNWPTPRCASKPWPAWPNGSAASTPAARSPSSPPRRSATGSPSTSPEKPGPDPRAAVGRHLHRPLHPRDRPGRRPGPRGGRLRRRGHRTSQLLRPDLDLHRPAGRRPPPAAAQPERAGPALDAGTPIVGLEPSCTAVLRADAAELLPDDPRAGQVRSAIKTLAELLTATERWSAPDLSGLSAVAQPHCHHHAVMGWQADAALLAGAGAQVTAVGGCCGLAGNFGVERGHYDVSRAVAETALLPAVRAAPPGATVLADGFSCRTQLDQLAQVRATHLAELLAARLEETWKTAWKTGRTALVKHPPEQEPLP